MVGEGRQLVIMFSNGGLNKANNKWPCVCVWGGGVQRQNNYSETAK